MLGAAGASERVVPNVAAAQAAERAAKGPRPRRSVRWNMGGDLGAGRERRHCGARRRRGAHHRGRCLPRATVMRHFRSGTLSISPLPIGVGAPPLEAGLVPLTGGAQARTAGPASAGGTAVAVTAIAVPAEEEDLAARRTRAGHEPQRFQAPSARARGSGPTRAGVRSRCRWIASALLDSAEGSELQLRALTLSPCRRLTTRERPPGQFPADPHAVGEASRITRFLVIANTCFCDARGGT
jgi:hypothetical protein